MRSLPRQFRRLYTRAAVFALLFFGSAMHAQPYWQAGNTLLSGTGGINSYWNQGVVGNLSGSAAVQLTYYAQESFAWTGGVEFSAGPMVVSGGLLVRPAFRVSEFDSKLVFTVGPQLAVQQQYSKRLLGGYSVSTTAFWGMGGTVAYWVSPRTAISIQPQLCRASAVGSDSQYWDWKSPLGIQVLL